MLRLVAVATALTALLLGADIAIAQHARATVEGTVRDADTGAPLGEAVVQVIDAQGRVLKATETDSAGAFCLRVHPGDSVRLRVERFGHTPAESVLLDLGGPLTLQAAVELPPRPPGAEGSVTAAKLRLDPNLEQFFYRKHTRGGRYLGPGEIARLQPTTATDMLMAMPAARLKRSDSGHGVEATVYVDGELLAEPEKLDIRIPADAIRGVEVYRHHHAAPPHFRQPWMGHGTIVLIWTDAGFGRTVSR